MSISRAKRLTSNSHSTLSLAAKLYKGRRKPTYIKCKIILSTTVTIVKFLKMKVSPCHHSTAHPEFAVG